MFTSTGIFCIFVNKNLMNKNLFPIRLHEARIHCGYSLDKLVKAANLCVTRQCINRYEKGIMQPKPEVVAMLAKTFGVSTEYFSGGSLDIDVPMLRSAKNYRLTAEEEKHLTSRLCFWAERYIRIEREVGCSAPFVNPIKQTAVRNLDDIIRASDTLRAAWRCGDGPIASVLRLLERKGIKILDLPLPNGIFGLSTWADHTHPLIVLDLRPEKTTVERLRFTACHELAHLLLTFPDDSEWTAEKRCEKFASFFLFPKQTFVEEMGSEHCSTLTLNELIDLKNVYGVSVQAMVHEAWDLRMITREHYDWWYNERIHKNWNEEGWGGYEFKETVGRERRVESVAEENETRNK